MVGPVVAKELCLYLEGVAGNEVLKLAGMCKIENKSALLENQMQLLIAEKVEEMMSLLFTTVERPARLVDTGRCGAVRSGPQP